MCVCVHACEGQRSVLGVLLNNYSSYFLNHALLSTLKPTDLGRPDGQEDPGILLSLCSNTGMVGIYGHT